MFKSYSDSPVESPESNSPAIIAPKGLHDDEAIPAETLPDERWKAEAFILDPRSAGFIAGKSRKLPDNGALFLLFFGLALAIFFWIPEIAERTQATATPSSAVSVTGSVVGRRMQVTRSSNGSSSTTYYVTYAYRIDQSNQSTEYRVEVPVSYDIYVRAETETQMQLPFLPEKISVPQPVVRKKSGNWGYSALFCTVIGVPMAISGWKSFRKNARLARRGKIVRGEVSKVSSMKGKNAYHLTVEYRFTGADGQPLTGRGSAIRTDLFPSGPLPTDGMPVYVIYDSRKTHRIL